MKNLTKSTLAAVALILGLAAYQLASLPAVPFHPDESSLLHESADLEIWLSHPLQLAWRAGGMPDDPQNYRALNAPLAKYVLGLGRRVAGFGPQSVAVDWDWSKTWDQNAVAGALPSDALLLAGRWASTLMIPLALIFIYLIGKEIGGPAVGLLAVLLVGSNALVLLHARRAMAEGTLLFGTAFAAWGVASLARRPGISGAAAALAVAAKQSAAPLALAGLAAGLWPTDGAVRRPNVRSGLKFAAAAVLLSLALQPFFWLHPQSAVAEMLRARQALVAAQVRDLGIMAPGRVLASPGDRAAALIGEVFIISPQLSEVGNYLTQTGEADSAYLANPVNRLLRGYGAGGLVLALTLLGLGLSVVRGKRRPRSVTASRFLAAAGLMLAGFLLAVNPLPVQRYYIPLIPFVGLWSAYAAADLARWVAGLRPLVFHSASQ